MLYIPSSLAKWKREAKEAHHYYSELFEGMLRDAQDRIVCSLFASPSRPHSFTLQNEGDERSSFAGTLLRERDHNHLSDTEAAWLSATM